MRNTHCQSAFTKHAISIKIFFVATAFTLHFNFLCIFPFILVLNFFSFHSASSPFSCTSIILTRGLENAFGSSCVYIFFSFGFYGVWFNAHHAVAHCLTAHPLALQPLTYHQCRSQECTHMKRVDIFINSTSFIIETKTLQIVSFVIRPNRNIYNWRWVHSSHAQYLKTYTPKAFSSKF